MSVRLTLVAAVARGGVIGDGGAIPWRVSSDFQHFKALTMGKPLVMGRRTFESIGKPLPGRETIVVTRDPSFAAPGVLVAPDLESALALARERAAALGVDEAISAGGGEIYRQTIGLADRIVLSEIELDREGDSHFPPIDPAQWREVSRTRHEAGPRDDAAFTVVVHERIRAATGAGAITAS